MKTYTYTETTEKTCLEIWHDYDAPSPREWDNIGYFITVDSRYSSPDNNQDMIDLVKATGQDASSLQEHIEEIQESINTTGEEVIYITPVRKYEHGNVVYKRGTTHGFDHSNNGFYIVTDKTAEVLGTPPELFDKMIDVELETYTNWANGQTYGFTIHNEEGGLIESVGGFYDIEDIKESLPEEYQKENLTSYISQ